MRSSRRPERPAHLGDKLSRHKATTATVLTSIPVPGVAIVSILLRGVSIAT